MATTWIIAADASRARVLQVAGPQRRLQQIEGLINPEGRMPRFSVEVFAHRVGQYLDQAHNEHRYDELVLVAPPKFLDALRKELGKEVERLIAEELPKDIAALNAPELQKYLKASPSGSAPGSGRAP